MAQFIRRCAEGIDEAIKAAVVATRHIPRLNVDEGYFRLRSSVGKGKLKDPPLRGGGFNVLYYGIKGNFR
jgi:hypothetical protein